MFSRVSRSLPVSFVGVFLFSVSGLFAQAQADLAPKPAFSARHLTVPTTYGQLPAIEVYFSPKGGCEAVIVRAIDHAQKTILVQAYEFKSKPIAEALVKAATNSKVKVWVILDKKQENTTEACLLKNHEGITVLISERPKDHNKTIVIDDSVTITGSFNFSEPRKRATRKICWSFATRGSPRRIPRTGKRRKSTSPPRRRSISGEWRRT